MVKIGKAAEGLYTLLPSCVPTSLQIHQCPRIHTTPSLEAQIWHFRLGHPSTLVLNKMSVLPAIDSSLYTTCDVCIQAKQQRLRLFLQVVIVIACLISYIVTSGVLINNVHMVNVLCFLPLYKNYPSTWVYLISEKSQVSSILQNFVVFIQTQFHVTVKPHALITVLNL